MPGKENLDKNDESKAEEKCFADETVKKGKSKMPREEKMSITAKRLRRVREDSQI